ncbi:MAG: HAD family hydrolase, partial [Alteromonadaceae bacterium]
MTVLYIFDWDGTLSDSVAKIVHCMQFAAEHSGLPVRDEHTTANIIGLGLPEAISKLYPDTEESRREHLRQVYVDHFIHCTHVSLSLFPKVLETLQILKEQGHLLTVATGKSRRGLNRNLRDFGLDTFFHGSRCADETVSKPDPAMLSELLTEFDCQAEDALMVGDSEYDMAMAQALNMPRIAVSYGVHSV